MDIFLFSVIGIISLFQLLGAACRTYQTYKQRKQRRAQFNRLYSDLLGGVTND